MKREIKSYYGGNQTSSAMVVIDKNGLRIEEKNPSYKSDSDFIQEFICHCINADQWQHSWHLDVSKAIAKKSEERTKIREILDGKIKQREDDIQVFKDAKQILGRWGY